MPAPPPASTSSTKPRESAGSSSFDYGLYHRADAVASEAAARAIRDPEELLSKGFESVTEVAEAELRAGGFDLDRKVIQHALHDGVEHAIDIEQQRWEPDSEYNKYASPHARAQRAERRNVKQPVRVRPCAPRRDRRLSGGRPRVRTVTRSSANSSARGDPDLGDEPPPSRFAWHKPGVFVCLEAGWAT